MGDKGDLDAPAAHADLLPFQEVAVQLGDRVVNAYFVPSGSQRQWLQRESPLLGIVTLLVAEAGNPSHLYFLSVTCGLSRALPSLLGQGDFSSCRDFELTIRVPMGPNDGPDRPPEASWPLGLLHMVASYLVEYGNHLESGHKMSWPFPLSGESSDSLLRSLIFTTDRELRSYQQAPEEGEADREVSFLQVVGCTTEEHRMANLWSVDPLLELIAEKTDNPLLITDLDRQCISDESDVYQAVQEGVARDGSAMSSQTSVFPVSLERDPSGKMLLLLAPKIVKNAGRVLPGRINFGNCFEILSGCLQHQLSEGEGVLPAEVFHGRRSVLVRVLLEPLVREEEEEEEEEGQGAREEVSPWMLLSAEGHPVEEQLSQTPGMEDVVPVQVVVRMSPLLCSNMSVAMADAGVGSQLEFEELPGLAIKVYEVPDEDL